MGSCYSKKTLASEISLPIQREKPNENSNVQPDTDEKTISPLQTPAVQPTPQPPPLTAATKRDLTSTLPLPSNDVSLQPARTYSPFNMFKKKKSMTLEDESRLPIPPPPLDSPIYSSQTATPRTMSTVPTLPMSVSSLNASKAPDNSDLPSHMRPDPISEKSFESETVSAKVMASLMVSAPMEKNSDIPEKDNTSKNLAHDPPVENKPSLPQPKDGQAERQLNEVADIEPSGDALEGSVSPMKAPQLRPKGASDGLSVPIRQSTAPVRRPSDSSAIPETPSIPQEMTKTDRLRLSTASAEQSSARAMPLDESSDKRAELSDANGMLRKTNLPMTEKPPMPRKPRKPRKPSKPSILTRPRTTIQAPRAEINLGVTAPKEEMESVIDRISSPPDNEASLSVDSPKSSDLPKKSPVRRFLARAVSAIQHLRPTASNQQGDRFSQTQPIPIAPPVGPPVPRRASLIIPSKKPRPVVPIEDKEVWTISGSFEDDFKMNRNDALEKPQLLKTLGLTNEITNIMRPPDLSSILAARNNLNKRQAPSVANDQARAGLQKQRPMYTSPQMSQTLTTDAKPQSDQRLARKSSPQLNINSSALTTAADGAKPSVRKEYLSKIALPALVPVPKDNRQPETKLEFSSKTTSTTELNDARESEEIPVSVSSSTPPLNTLVYLPSRNQKRPMRTKATLIVKSRMNFPPAPSTANPNGEQPKKQLSEEVAEGSEGKQLTAKKFSAASQRGSTTRGESSLIEGADTPSARAENLSGKSTAKQLPTKTMTKSSIRSTPEDKPAKDGDTKKKPTQKQSAKASRVQDLIAKFADKPTQNAKTFGRRQTVPSRS